MTYRTHAHTWTAALTFGLLAGCGDGASKLEDVKVESETTSFGYRMAKVPGGTYQLGAGGEGNAPRHQVQVSPYLIGMTEVTVAQFEAVMGKQERCKSDDYTPEPEHPVACVSWDEAVEFANRASEKDGLTPCYTYVAPKDVCEVYESSARDKLLDAGMDLRSATIIDPGGSSPCSVWGKEGGGSRWTRRECTGYRLPTDAEWEVAARGGSDTPDPNAKVEDLEWVGENADGLPHAVARKAPNAYGLFDMLGNVREWVFDTRTDEPLVLTPNPVVEPASEGGTDRGLRGFSHVDQGAAVAQLGTSAERTDTAASSSRRDIGLRLVKSLDPSVVGRTYARMPDAIPAESVVATVKVEETEVYLDISGNGYAIDGEDPGNAFLRAVRDYADADFRAFVAAQGPVPCKTELWSPIVITCDGHPDVACRLVSGSYSVPSPFDVSAPRVDDPKECVAGLVRDYLSRLPTTDIRVRSSARGSWSFPKDLLNRGPFALPSTLINMLSVKVSMATWVKPSVPVDLPPVSIPLADGGSLDATLSVVVGENEQDAITAHAAQIGAAVAETLKARPFTELDTWDGKVALAAALRPVVATAAGLPLVRDVRFTSFVLTGPRNEPWWTYAYKAPGTPGDDAGGAPQVVAAASAPSGTEVPAPAASAAPPASGAPASAAVPAALQTPVWVVSVGAFPDAAAADAFISKAASEGHAGLSKLWIPDYASLSGKPLFVVYDGPIPYADREAARQRATAAQTWAKGAYAVKIDRSPGREEIRP